TVVALMDTKLTVVCRAAASACCRAPSSWRRSSQDRAPRPAATSAPASATSTSTVITRHRGRVPRPPAALLATRHSLRWGGGRGGRGWGRARLLTGDLSRARPPGRHLLGPTVERRPRGPLRRFAVGRPGRLPAGRSGGGGHGRVPAGCLAEGRVAGRGPDGHG